MWFLRKESLIQLKLLTQQRKEIDLSVICCDQSLIQPCSLVSLLYRSHFLHDSTFLSDTPCLGKGSIISPCPADTAVRRHPNPFCFRCWVLAILQDLHLSLLTSCSVKGKLWKCPKTWFQHELAKLRKGRWERGRNIFQSPRFYNQNFEAYRIYLFPTTPSVSSNTGIIWLLIINAKPQALPKSY